MATLSAAQSLQAHPNSIATESAGFDAHADVVLQNDTSQELSQVSLTAFSNDGIVAVINKISVLEAPPKGEVDWPIELKIPSSAHLPGSVVFRANFKANDVPGVLYTTVDVGAAGSQKPVDVSLEGTPDPISQQRPARLNLIVTNNLDVPVTVSVQHQPTLGGLIIRSVSDFQVSPHSEFAQPIDLTASFRVTPGSQSAVIDVDVRWAREDQTNQSHFVLTKTVTVGVFFESEILKALSVPSFLALPGCLLLFTLQFLLSTGWMGVKNQSSLPSLSVSSPGFWVISLSLSALFVAAYYLVTGVNCLLTYGIGDIGIIWISSILIGLATFVIYALIRSEWIRDHIVTTSDTPRQVLEKIARNNLPLLRPGVRFKLNGVDLSGLTLETIADGQTLVWVTPHISVNWEAGKTAEQATNSQNFQERFNDIINLTRDPGQLVKLINEADHFAVLEFDSTAVFPGPYHLKTDAIAGPAPDQLIVG
ncbi:MAG: hypothetical protein ACRD3N_12020 [Terracidiphilus sp.]